MITLHDPIARGGRRPTEDEKNRPCRRCGSHDQARRRGGPYCGDCRAIIARDPGYLAQLPDELREMIMREWIDTRPGKKMGSKRPAPVG